MSQPPQKKFTNAHAELDGAVQKIYQAAFASTDPGYQEFFLGLWNFSLNFSLPKLFPEIQKDKQE